MRVSLAEINALRNMSRSELADKAAEFNVQPGPEGSATWPTNDSLRLAIIDRMIDRVTELEVDNIDTASKVGAEHFAEAVSIHALSVEFDRRADELWADGHTAESGDARQAASRGYEAARSAAAIAQAGLTAAALGAMADVLQGMGRTL
jgi:hypothetical protein